LPKRRLMARGPTRPRESHRAHFLVRCLCPAAVDNEVGEVLWKRRSGLPQHQLGSSRTAQGVQEMATTNASARGGTVWSIRNLLVTAVALLALLGIGFSGHVLRNASLERATAA